jgi:hypothetical protein
MDARRVRAVIRGAWLVGLLLGWVGGCAASLRDAAAERRGEPPYREVALGERVVNVQEGSASGGAAARAAPAAPAAPEDGERAAERPDRDEPAVAPRPYLVVAAVVQLSGPDGATTR